MSFIVRSLELLFQTPQEIEAEKREKEQTIRPARRKDADPPTFRCRVCHLESPERGYCPVCIADTMEPVARR